MKINFQHLVIHNFLSFGHSEFDLNDLHYCLVSGVNHCSKDNAKSNGSGKSTFSSAICYALTGQTLQDISTNLKNINIDEPSCYVELEFTVDSDHYLVKRIREPKSDLHIELNGKDISGKGIRESEAILAKYLPDLNSQLIASIIILGQGLPYKFTANTPSGRKDILESLSKSDFMIQDLKDRIATRSQQLATSLRGFEDNLLSANSNKKLLEQQLTDANSKLAELNIDINYDEQINVIQNSINDLDNRINTANLNINKTQIKINELNSKLNKLNQDKSEALLQANLNFNNSTAQLNQQKAELNSQISTLQFNIQKLKSIKDICPTCGQKLPNIVKPDTTQEEIQLEEFKNNLSKISSQLNGLTVEHNTYLSQIEADYKNEISNTNSELAQNKQNQSIYNSDLQQSINKKASLITDLNNLKLLKNTHEQELNNINATIDNLTKHIAECDDKILYNNAERNTVNEHISVINQMSTLIKRDFRGYLLGNVIAFINETAQIYAKDIFNDADLRFELNGNNIDILYNNKPFENLSGGEKQRVDLIIQFAIRNMMSKYLNFSSNILVLDEVLDSLDAISSTNVINFISKNCMDVESLFFISHHADALSVPCDYEMIITKSEEGISTVSIR